MNLIIKVMLISSLFSSFISCKLYEKLTNKSQQALAKAFVYDKDIADNKSTNSTSKLDNSSLDSIKDNNRSGRTSRALDDAEEIGVKESNQNRNDQQQNNESKVKESEKNNSSGIQADDSVLGTAHSDASEVENKKHDTSRQPQLLNKDSSEAREASKIIQKASTSLEEAEKVNAALKETRSKLDKIKRLADSAKSYLNNARKNSRTNGSILEILPNLDKAIEKAISSYASLNVCYTDAIAALAKAKNDFEHAKRKANDALEEALKDITHFRGYNYLYHYRINNANDAMESAKSLLEVAKNKQKELNENITKTNKDFQELNDIYKKLQDMDSR
ncbi:immunogenic protein P37 [Borreliella burgdorferi]|uniref:immunogenic protein P37 n=1 Tax=Borreliella burgdorferi TaxID=139 RepID=UPI000D02ECE8|nr:immunogenic protein P37 [Borreliella burgdorferi]MCD2413744.1 immunogenic protein P37 [Borreliella burgdorferi]MCD2413745.1 immunogenic protein P37 [Borreliella burgdorferi]PRR13755.1 immunogenic protein P37 [Borreliella burgdorferi]PRR17442.1 immunogenic protein P37 [Borreliella burgdorferi]PRR21101.1 immunogenic protein P37 [Borreliella burgdorferi]